MENYQAAEPLYHRALQIRETAYGRQHPETANCLADMANLFVRQGKDSEAEPLLKRSLAIRQKVLSAGHPAIGESLSLLARLNDRAGRRNEALQYQDRAQQNTRQHLARVLPGISESARKIYLNTRFSSHFAEAMAFGLAHATDRRAAMLSAGWLVNSKSAPQEAIAEAALLSTPEAAPLVAELRDVRSQLAQLTLLSANQVDDTTRQHLAGLETRERQLQQQISGLGLGLQQTDPWISAGTLMGKIPFESVLVNVARFQSRERPEAYVAWIIPSAGTGDVRVVELGDAAGIDAEVARVRTEFQEKQLLQISDDAVAAEKSYRKKAATLSRLVLAPLEEFLQDADEVIVSPDSELWTIPWEALITSNDRYFVESYRMRYVLSGRELVHRLPARSLISPPVIFADPDYDLAATEVLGTTQNRSALRFASGTYFPRLAKSAAEAVMIEPAIQAYTEKTPRVLLADGAQEATFKDLHRPQVLVMSTHGYFERNQPDGTAGNPLLRCGLALAGCNHRQQAAADGREDGILTGLEIVGTDLRGTQLVVLSACETGLGDIRSGEGVAGLRQAFQLAGAQSVIASLWKVEDGETARLMTAFFQNLANGLSKSAALRQAQLSRMQSQKKRRGGAHPFLWAAFTLTGLE